MYVFHTYAYAHTHTHTRVNTSTTRAPLFGRFQNSNRVCVSIRSAFCLRFNRFLDIFMCVCVRRPIVTERREPWGSERVPRELCVCVCECVPTIRTYYSQTLTSLQNSSDSRSEFDFDSEWSRDVSVLDNIHTFLPNEFGKRETACARVLNAGSDRIKSSGRTARADNRNHRTLAYAPKKKMQNARMTNRQTGSLMRRVIAIDWCPKPLRISVNTCKTRI